jgi:tetratricopeptide (TPR) repeat protein
VKLVAVFLAIAVHTTAAQPAHEDSDTAADKAAVARAAAVAREADAAGRAHYRDHDFAAAVDDYRRAHDALPDPLFLFDMAQAYRKLSDCEHAAEMYRAYLQDRPDADNRLKVERFIRTMDACTPPPQQQPQPQFAPPVEPTPASSESNARAWQFMGIGTGTIGLFLVGAGIYFSADASRDQSQIEAACASGCRGADVHALDASGHDANRNAAITYSIGGAALAAGAGMILWSLLGSPSDTAPSIAPVAGGAIVSGQGHF